MENDLKDKIKINQVDGELAPFEIDPESAEKMGYEDQLPEPPAGQPQAGPDAGGMEPLAIVSEASMRRWLGVIFRGGYVVNTILDKDADEDTHKHWPATDEELDFITPLMTEWVNGKPEYAKVVHDLETTGAPAIILSMLAFRQLKSLRIRRQRRKENGDQFAATVQSDTRTGVSSI